MEADGELDRIGTMRVGEMEWALSRRLRAPIESFVDFANTVNPYPLEGLRDAASSFSGFSLYPDVDMLALKNAITKHYGAGSADNVIVSNGSTALIYLISKLAKGGEAIIPVPTYDEYPVSCKKNGCRPVFTSRNADFSLSIKNIKAKMSSKTRLVFICNPNNPTGTVSEKGEIEQIIEIAREKGAVVVIDEAYMRFTKNPDKNSCVDLALGSENVIVIDGISKIFGVPSIRVGWGVSSPGLIRSLSKLQVPKSVGGIDAFITEKLLSYGTYVKRSASKLALDKHILESELSALPHVEVLPSCANFMLLRLDGSINSTLLFAKLARVGIIVRDCSAIRGLDDRYVRVSVKRRKDNARLIDAMRRILATRNE